MDIERFENSGARLLYVNKANVEAASGFLFLFLNATGVRAESHTSV